MSVHIATVTGGGSVSVPSVGALLASLARPFSLVPGGLAHPAEGESCVRADLDGSCFRLSDRLLHRLHQILGVVDQHLRGLGGGNVKSSNEKHCTQWKMEKMSCIQSLITCNFDRNLTESKGCSKISQKLNKEHSSIGQIWIHNGQISTFS